MNDSPAFTIRDATAGNLPAINDIYNPYVAHSTCTWQTQPDTIQQRQAWFTAHGGDYPVIVAEVDGQVIG